MSEQPELSKEIFKVPDEDIIEKAKELQRVTWHYNYWADWFMISTNQFWEKMRKKYPDMNIDPNNWYYDFDTNYLVHKSKILDFYKYKKVKYGIEYV